MSEYEEQIDGANAVCPYCEYSYQVEGEDFDEDERQEECGKCGKAYWLSQSFSVDHHTRPDCKLNGTAHVFEELTFSDGRKAEFCNVCNECRLTA